MVDYDSYISQIESIFEENQKQLDSIDVFTYEGVSYYDGVIDEDFVRAIFKRLKTSLFLAGENLFIDSLAMLRVCFEETLFAQLYILASKAKLYREYVIIPSQNENPVARDNTLKMWNSNLKEWRKDKTSSLKNFEDVLQIFSVKGTDDRIGLIVEVNKVFERRDVDKTGYWMTPFKQLFIDYNPLDAHLDAEFIDENGSLNGDEVDSKKRIASKIYKKFLTINGLIDNLQYNDLLSQEEAKRIKIHYNFLSLFIHPNKRKDRFLSSSRDSHLLILIYLYVVKMQQILIKTLLLRRKSLLDERGLDSSVVDSALVSLDQSNSFCDFFWFIYDEPFDKHYYVDPFKWLWDALWTHTID